MRLFKLLVQDYMDEYPHSYYLVGTRDFIDEFINHMNHSAWSGTVWLYEEIPFSKSYKWTREFWNNLLHEGNLGVLPMEKYLPEYEEEFKEFSDSLKESKCLGKLIPKSQKDFWVIYCLNKARLYLPQSILAWKRR